MDSMKMKEHMLKRMEIGFGHLIPDYLIAELDQLQLEQYLNTMVDGMVFNLRLFLAGEQHQTVAVKYPADWWQAFKKQSAPAWFLKKYPVSYTEVVVGADIFYPFIALPDQRKVIKLYEVKGG
jgi:hypothetical protein